MKAKNNISATALKAPGHDKHVTAQVGHVAFTPKCPRIGESVTIAYSLSNMAKRTELGMKWCYI